MSSKSHLPKHGSLKFRVLYSIFYLLLFGAGVSIFQFIDPAPLKEIGVLTIAMWVSIGAAIGGFSIALLSGGIGNIVPPREAIPRLILTAIIVAASSLVFWHVSLSASMMLAAVAQPLRVIMESMLASRIYPNPNQSMPRDRMVFDAVLGLGLLASVLATTSVSVPLLPAVVLVGVLVTVGAASELALMGVQLRASDHTVHPATQIGFINALLAIGFFTGAHGLGHPIAPMDAGLVAPLLMVVVLVGTAAPTIVKLKLLKSVSQPAEVSILALGFAGAVNAVILIAAAALWLLAFLLPLPLVQAFVHGQLATAGFATISIVIMIFVLTRFWSAKPGGGNGPSDPSGGDARKPNAYDTDWATRSNPEASKDYDASLRSLAAARDAEQIAGALSRLQTARRSLGHAGFMSLPANLLRDASKRVADTPQKAVAVRDSLVSYQQARAHAQGISLTTPEGRRAVRAMDQAYAALHDALRDGARAWNPFRLLTPVRSAILMAALRLALGVEAIAAPTAKLARAVPGQTGVEIWANALGGLLDSFASSEALLKTGLETSVGFRLVIPGTGGLVANMGLWVMFYSGSIAGFLTRSNPMLVNPGVTIATPFWIGTYNRPGIGMGPSLPFGNAYLDAQRYKLLLGADGVGYVRVGHWEGRGPYGTVSGSFPMFPGVRGTWNASLFSPGLEPVVHRSTPLARWIRAKSEAASNRLTRLFR